MNRLNIIQRTNKSISCNENNKTLLFTCNGRMFCKIHLDSIQNSSISDSDLSCDYIIVSEELKDIALWVELKGNDTKHALKQIEQSMQDFGKDITKKYAAIVCSKFHPQFDRYKREFIKRNKVPLFPKATKLQLRYNPSNQTIST